MRKALIGLIMAATVMTPIVAQAQERGERRSRHVQQEGSARGGERYEQRQARQEQRQARQEQRQARQEPRQARQEPRQVRVEPRAEQQPAADARIRATNRWIQRNAGGEGVREVRQDRREWRQDRRDDRVDRRQDRRDDRQDWRQDRRDDRRDWRSGRRDDRRDWRQDRRADRRDWNRDWRRDNRYNWQDWRYRNRSIFSGSRYFAPYRNHRYSRFSIGLILGSPFYSQRYWLSDPWQYRLPPAPYGTQWVRYYDDVLLVDVYTGEVIDVIYDFFW